MTPRAINVLGPAWADTIHGENDNKGVSFKAQNAKFKIQIRKPKPFWILGFEFWIFLSVVRINLGKALLLNLESSLPLNASAVLPTASGYNVVANISL
jgi:hypothetical protein